MADDGGGRWAADTADLVPMMVLMPEQRRAAMLAGGLQAPATQGYGPLDALYNEAMARFDAFCFWYARPPRTRHGLRVVAERLETYGSPDALRIAGAVRQALAE